MKAPKIYCLSCEDLLEFSHTVPETDPLLRCPNFKNHPNIEIWSWLNFFALNYNIDKTSYHFKFSAINFNYVKKLKVWNKGIPILTIENFNLNISELKTFKDFNDLMGCLMAFA